MLPATHLALRTGPPAPTVYPTALHAPVDLQHCETQPRDSQNKSTKLPYAHTLAPSPCSPLVTAGPVVLKPLTAGRPGGQLWTWTGPSPLPAYNRLACLYFHLLQDLVWQPKTNQFVTDNLRYLIYKPVLLLAPTVDTR